MRREYSFSKVRRPLPGSTGLKYCTGSSEWRFMYQFPWWTRHRSIVEKSSFLMFLYCKDNQSFGMCKQKGKKNIKILDFSSSTASIILNSFDSRYISQSASRKVISFLI